MPHNEQYNVMFYGDITQGNTCAQVKNSLTTHFHMEPRQLEQLFTRTPFLLKRDVDYATAVKYQILFGRAGLLGRIESTTDPLEAVLSTPPEYYNVVFRGELCEGYLIDDVKRNLMAFLHLTTNRIDRMFAGPPVILMRDADAHPALKMQMSIELAGARCRLESVKHDRPPALAANALLSAQPEAQTPSDVAYMRCPKCGFQQPQTRKCRHCGCHVHTDVKKRLVCWKFRLKQSVQHTDAAMKQELLYWGIGFSVFGEFQMIGLGVWAMGFVGIGLLNLLFRRCRRLLVGRGMFLVNGVTLVGSGAWSLVMALSKSVGLLSGNTGIPLEIGHVESGMLVGGFMVWYALQIGIGLYGLGRFKQYVSTHQALSKRMRRIR